MRQLMLLVLVLALTDCQIEMRRDQCAGIGVQWYRPP